MPYDDQILKRALTSRARRARERGIITQTQHPVAPIGSASIDFRDHALFADITGQDLIGFAVTGTMQTGPDP